MKSILIPVRPKWVSKILNGEKTAEIRKTAPKEWVDYLSGKTAKRPEPMFVYIYCTKGDYIGRISKKYVGKVVARFTLNKVEEISWQMGVYELEQQWFSDFLDKCCLSFWELKNYLNRKNGYAWHISDLEIFREPKELSEFKSYKKNIVNTKINGIVFETELDNSLIKAPQSWCYVED